MLLTRVYSEDWEVGPKLGDFGVIRDEMIVVAEKVMAARAEAVDGLDAATAEGQFAYLHGTRNTRALFMSKGWLHWRENGIEGVSEPGRSRKIVYQSVEQAGGLDAPKAKKKSGAQKLVSDAQGSLFGRGQADEAVPPHLVLARPTVWFHCVSVQRQGDDVFLCSELSLPAYVKDDESFGPFVERILILRPGDWKGPSGRMIDPRLGDRVEFEPKISRG